MDDAGQGCCCWHLHCGTRDHPGSSLLHCSTRTLAIWLEMQICAALWGRGVKHTWRRLAHLQVSHWSPHQPGLRPGSTPPLTLLTFITNSANFLLPSVPLSHLPVSLSPCHLSIPPYEWPCLIFFISRFCSDWLLTQVILPVVFAHVVFVVSTKFGILYVLPH